MHPSNNQSRNFDTFNFLIYSFLINLYSSKMKGELKYLNVWLSEGLRTKKQHLFRSWSGRRRYQNQSSQSIGHESSRWTLSAFLIRGLSLLNIEQVRRPVNWMDRPVHRNGRGWSTSTLFSWADLGKFTKRGKERERRRREEIANFAKDALLAVARIDAFVAPVPDIIRKRN